VKDAENFVERASLETFTSVLAGESREFKLNFQNTINIPVSDLTYEFRIWVRANGSAIIERIPVFVTVKAE